MFESKEIIQIVKENIEGIDDFTVIPMINLEAAMKETLLRIERGLIPSLYHWTDKKTKYAYHYKNYGKWAKSIFLAAKYYYTDEDEKTRSSNSKSSCYGKIARYTWRNNYQYLINKLNEVVSLLEKKLNITIKHKAISNYTSIPEKVLFNWSGLAKIGKNSLLINPKFGSYFVIGEVFTDLNIEFKDSKGISQPDFSICRNCTKCIEACPTDAIIENGVLNINRCLQFISENLILIDNDIREKWGNRLYGCSTCLDVCPYNQKLSPTAEKHGVGFVGSGFNLINIIKMDDKKWNKLFSNNQIGIKNRLAIIKNAILSIGNLRCNDAIDILHKLLKHENDIIRAYTVWALSKIEGKNIKDTLKSLLKKETSEIVKKEIENAIKSID